jgi:hypothetical protein
MLPESEDDGKVRIIKGNADDMQYLVVEFPDDILDGYRYMIAKTQNNEEGDEDNITYVFYDEGVDDGYLYGQVALKQAFTRLMGLKAESVVVTETDDLSQYGLDEESAVEVVAKPWEGKDVQEIRLLIGNHNDIYNGYYAKLPDKPEVYLISISDGNTFVKGSLRFRSLDLIPDFGGENYGKVKFFTLTNMDGDEITLKRHESYMSDVENEFIYTMFSMIQPYTAYASDDVLLDKIFEPIGSASIVQAIQNRPTEEDLKGYGFDTSCSLKFELDDFTITFKYGIPGGNVDSGVYYLMVDGVDTVYEVLGSAPFAQLKPMDILSSHIWMHDIKKVDTVEIKIPSGSHVLMVDDRTTTDGSGVFLASFDSKAISEGNARSLYLSILTIEYDDIIADTLLETTPSYKFTIKYKSGFTETVSFYKVTSRQYAVLFDDAPLEDAGFCVNIKGLRAVAENIDTILSGGTIK